MSKLQREEDADASRKHEAADLMIAQLMSSDLIKYLKKENNEMTDAILGAMISIQLFSFN